MKRIVFSLVVFFTSFVVKGSHTIGADITYRCLNTNGDFEVTLIVYTDCSGVSFCLDTCGTPCTTVLGILGAETGCENNNYGFINLSLVQVRDVAVSPFCPNVKNNCNNRGCVTPGTFTPGIEQYVFVGQVNLGANSQIPMNCCLVKLSFSQCCRNSGISTGAANANFYTEAVIDRCKSTNPCNSSPVITHDPLSVICNAQPLSYQPIQTMDPDLDSLSFSFEPSLGGPGASVPYTPPYAYDRPMPWTGPASGVFPNGIHINPSNGTIQFTPNVGGPFVGVIAIGITQYRKNTLTQQFEFVGKTRRDMQVWIKDCGPNVLPELYSLVPGSGDSTTSTSHWELCANKPFCMDFKAYDSDSSDTTYISWNASLASKGASFIPQYQPAHRRISGPRNDHYRFCWTPKSSDVREYPYALSITGTDSKCPMPGKSIRQFLFYVKPNPVATLHKDTFSCHQWKFSIFSNETIPAHRVHWRLSKKPNDPEMIHGYTEINERMAIPSTRFFEPGRYYIHVYFDIPNSGACTLFLRDSVDQSADVLGADVSDTTICQRPETPLTLHSSWYNPSGNPASFHWYVPGFPEDTLSKNTSLTLNAEMGMRAYVLQVTQSGSCTITDTVTLLNKFPGGPMNMSGATLVTAQQEVVYTMHSHPMYTFHWMVTNGTILYGQNTNSVVVKWHSDSTGKISAVVKNGNCVGDTISQNITVQWTGLTQLVKRARSFTVYPNPARTKLYLDISMFSNEVELTDMLGRMYVLKTQVEPDGKRSLQIANLPTGMYVVMVRFTDGSSYWSRFTKE